MTLQNATEYLDAGASHVIVTSYVFRDGRLDQQRLHELVNSDCINALSDHLSATPQLTLDVLSNSILRSESRSFKRTICCCCFAIPVVIRVYF